MNRKELEAKAFNIIANSMEYIDTPAEVIWEEIHKATDEQIKVFLEEIGEEQIWI